jgi:hypothetical protein
MNNVVSSVENTRSKGFGPNWPQNPPPVLTPKRRNPLCGASSSSGDGIRTRDLRVMSAQAVRCIFADEGLPDPFEIDV